uniref:Trafficking protein particle complex subunit n=1 Tax=Compsopogon caeruleus TaxID=31354 RepID=A0A7S1T8C1_9RHOD|mmetsp:Transcript_12990/g.26354  ORF Transcript_12990/g.26354 Transcript_12990/m.26354 type:complete len:124 (+) Transcript_12990:136-507(+)
MPVLYIISPDNRMVGKQMVVAQLVVNAALDMVDEMMWRTRDMNLKVVDRFDDQVIHAFVTAGNFRFMLLSDGKQEEGARTFFFDLYELFTRVLMNPLHDRSTSVSHPIFRERVRQLTRKHFIY